MYLNTDGRTNLNPPVYTYKSDIELKPTMAYR